MSISNCSAGFSDAPRDCDREVHTFLIFFVRWVVATLAMHKPIFTMNENEIPPLHIGNLIREQLRLQRRSVAWLATQIGCKRDNVYKLLRHYYITTDTLMRISLALDYDFFADLSTYFHNSKMYSRSIRFV